MDKSNIKRLQDYSAWCHEQVQKQDIGSVQYMYWIGRWHSAEDIALVACEAKDFLESELL